MEKIWSKTKYGTLKVSDTKYGTHKVTRLTISIDGKKFALEDHTLKDIIMYLYKYLVM